MRFHEFLRATVLLSAGAASLLAAVTLAGVAASGSDRAVAEIGVGWWIAGVLIGLWLGRRADASPPIASLLAGARTRQTLPEVNPGLVLVNRLWPLLVVSVGAVAIGVPLPQVPAIAAGFALIWSLSWRRQASAVQAIEARDGARFYIERTSPLRPIELVRTPGFRTDAAAEAPSAAPAVGDARTP